MKIWGDHAGKENLLQYAKKGTSGRGHVVTLVARGGVALVGNGINLLPGGFGVRCSVSGSRH